MTTRRWLVAGAVAAAGTAAAGLPAAGAQVPPDRLIRLVDNEPRQVGALSLGGSDRLRKALRAYGKPTRKRSVGGRSACRVRWQDPGITVLAVTFDTPPRRRCDSRRLSVQQIAVSRPGWTTDRGLTIGDSLDRAREVYGAIDDEFEKNLYVLELQDDASVPQPTPRLMAKVSKGRVIRFEVFVGAAGD